MLKALAVIACSCSMAGLLWAEPVPPSKTVAEPDWVAAAPGRVRPQGGEAHAGTAVSGLIAGVTVQVGDRVKAGDLLVHLVDDEFVPRLSSARNEAALRLKDRDATDAVGLALDRRKAGDLLYAEDDAFFDARLKLDATIIALHEGKALPFDVERAREALTEARGRAAVAKGHAAQIDRNDKLPPSIRTEAAVASARSDVYVLFAIIEKMRLRSPIDGAVLRVDAKAGEVAVPGAAAGLVTVGNVDRLQVEAEIDERDVGKLRVGQAASVKTGAFPSRSFDARVSQIAISLDAPKLTSRNVRRPTDIDVLQVVLDLDAASPLLPGMRADVFFAAQDAVEKRRAADAR